MGKYDRFGPPFSNRWTNPLWKDDLLSPNWNWRPRFEFGHKPDIAKLDLDIIKKIEESNKKK